MACNSRAHAFTGPGLQAGVTSNVCGWFMPVAAIDSSLPCKQVQQGMDVDHTCDKGASQQAVAQHGPSPCCQQPRALHSGWFGPDDLTPGLLGWSGCRVAMPQCTPQAAAQAKHLQPITNSCCLHGSNAECMATQTPCLYFQTLSFLKDATSAP